MLKKGEKMEHVRVYIHSLKTDAPMVIDKTYYLEKAFLNIFARFIAFDDRFAHPTVKITDADSYKIVDDYSGKKAGDFLLDYLRSFGKNQQRQLNEKAAQYQRVFRAIDKALKCPTLRSVGYTIGNGATNAENILRITMENVTSGIDMSKMDHVADAWITRKLNLLSVFQMYTATSRIVKVRQAKLWQIKDATMTVLYDIIREIVAITAKREDKVATLVRQLRETPTVNIADDTLADVEAIPPEVAVKYHKCVTTLKSVEQVTVDIGRCFAVLEQYRRKVTGRAIFDRTEISNIVAEDVKAVTAVIKRDDEHPWR